MKYLLLFLALISTQGWAIDRVKIVTEDLPPLSYKNNEGEVIGAATKRVRELMAQAQIDYDIAILPWKRALKSTLEEPNTLIYTILKTPQREHNFEWFCPIARPLKIYLYSLPDNSPSRMQSIEDAKSSLVGVSRGSVAHGILLSKGFKEGHNLVVTTGIDVLKQNLQNGRLDYILVIDTAVADIPNISKVLPNSFSTEYIPCLAINKNSDEKIKERLRLAFSKLPAINN